MATSKVIDYQVLGDGTVTVKVRCNDDPTTDSVATIHVTPEMAALTALALNASIDTQIAEHQARVEQLYDARSKVKTLIQAKIAALVVK